MLAYVLNRPNSWVRTRDAFRHHCFMPVRPDGAIAGCGTPGHLLAPRRMAKRAEVAG